jgi:phosphopantothenoylcysteine decarboxylase / phosphopantothenate---cysteine ligase
MGPNPEFLTMSEDRNQIGTKGGNLLVPSSFENRRILVGITGGIAAYKVCDALSTLAKAGAQVRAILTRGAHEFITPLTVTTLSRHPAYTDAEFWQPVHSRPLHIELGEWADVLLIAPLTANTLAKLRMGLADNLLTNTVLASNCPILLAPAMNTEMWNQPVTQQNWQQVLSGSRFHGLDPGSGLLACDRVGTGRMAEPERILAHVESILHTQGKQDLAGKRVLISAGSTRESFDPVRFIGNPATGKMGIALARAALHRGAEVTLVGGSMSPGFQDLIPGAKVVTVTRAQEMQQVMLDYFPEADMTVMAAAVADVRPVQSYGHKVPKQSLPASLPLEPVPDIIAQLGQVKQSHQWLIGFAAQTGDIIPPAMEKLRTKKLDAIVANPIDRPNAGFGSETNQAVLIDVTGRQQAIAPCSKLKLAHHLFDFIQSLSR